MTIQRYSMEDPQSGMIEDNETGEWVKSVDAENAIAVLMLDVNDKATELENLRQQVQTLQSDLALADSANSVLETQVQDLRASNLVLSADNVAKTQQAVESMTQCNAMRANIRTAVTSLNNLLISN